VRKQLIEQRWPWLVAAGVLVIIILSTFFEIRLGGDWDHRPLGSAEDIAQLRDRDDLNVMFILIDTLRAERLGSYGYDRDTSPVLDRLANSGVRFERHLAQSSWTKASMASLWTGLFPARTGITRFDHVIPDEALMATELLRDAGFETVGLYRNGWVAPTFGFDQGFDVYQRPIAAALPPEVRRENPTLSERSTDAGVLESAEEFLRVSGPQRWFLYMHLMDLHEYVYDAESAIFGSSYSDIYDNSIRWTDETIEILLGMLSDLGHLENTIIVIASDHGEAFLERGFEGHARRVYRETTEVPFMLSLPFRLEPGVVVKTRTQNVDIWPTVLDLLGLEPPEGIDGRSRLPDVLASLSGEPLDDGGRIAIAELDQNWAQRDRGPLPTVAIVEDSFRYVRIDEADGEGSEKRTESLFDARDDPRERHNLASEDPETLERLRAAADDYTRTEPTWGEAPTREISELELNLLRALGYKL
jgi:arylsulfatase A-like enzyme